MITLRGTPFLCGSQRVNQLSPSAREPARLAHPATRAVSKRVPEFAAGLFSLGFKPFHYFRVLSRQISRLTDVADQVVELGRFHFALFIRGGQTIVAARLAGKRA